VQHLFGGASSTNVLVNRCGAARREPREQHRRLYLRAGDRDVVLDAVQDLGTLYAQRRRDQLTVAADARAHQSKWQCDAVHRSLRQRFVTHQFMRASDSADDATK
jgi:hypothetical protein